MRDPEDPPTVRTHESRGQGMMLRGIDPTCGDGPPRASEAGQEEAVPMGMGAMGGGMAARCGHGPDVDADRLAAATTARVLSGAG